MTRFEKITRILAIVDPMGIVDIGCNDMEYSPEALLIEKHLNKKGYKSLKKTIGKIFKKMFDYQLNYEVIEKIDAEISELREIEYLNGYSDGYSDFINYRNKPLDAIYNNKEYKNGYKDAVHFCVLKFTHERNLEIYKKWEESYK